MGVLGILFLKEDDHVGRFNNIYIYMYETDDYYVDQVFKNLGKQISNVRRSEHDAYSF